MRMVSTKRVKTTLVENDLSDFLTDEQLAEKLKISPRTLATWITAKRIPRVKVGNIVRFDWARVRAALLKFEVK